MTFLLLSSSQIAFLNMSKVAFSRAAGLVPTDLVIDTIRNSRASQNCFMERWLMSSASSAATNADLPSTAGFEERVSSTSSFVRRWSNSSKYLSHLVDAISFVIHLHHFFRAITQIEQLVFNVHVYDRKVRSFSLFFDTNSRKISKRVRYDFSVPGFFFFRFGTTQSTQTLLPSSCTKNRISSPLGSVSSINFFTWQACCNRLQSLWKPAEGVNK